VRLDGGAAERLYTAPEQAFLAAIDWIDAR